MLFMADLLIYGCSIMATKASLNHTSSAHGSRVVRAKSLEEAREILKKDASANWPASEGWEVTYSLTEVPIQWMVHRPESITRVQDTV